MPILEAIPVLNRRITTMSGILNIFGHGAGHGLLEELRYTRGQCSPGLGAFIVGIPRGKGIDYSANVNGGRPRLMHSPLQ